MLNKVGGEYCRVALLNASLTQYSQNGRVAASFNSKRWSRKRHKFCWGIVDSSGKVDTRERCCVAD